MIATGGQLAMEPEGTNVGPILILHSMGYEGFVGNAHGVFAGLPGLVANHEAVFANQSSCRKPNILHDELIGHQPPISLGLGFATTRTKRAGQKLGPPFSHTRGRRRSLPASPWDPF